MMISMYYTNKSLLILREKDPIMQQIKDSEKKYAIDPVDAKITENEMIPGIYGKSINYEKTYHEMKKNGSYNELYTIINNVKPTISIEDNYDKYITKGNPNKKQISIIFIASEKKNYQKTLHILEETNSKATFFIDGSLLENNYNWIKQLKEYELEILSYENNYEEIFLKTSISYLNTITNQPSKFCFTEYENKKLLDFCRKEKYHTIKKSITKRNLYQEVKNHLENAMIIAIDNYMEEELQITIDYIKKKGYQLVTLEELLKED